MSNTNKTKQKLMETMRMTKAGSKKPVESVAAQPAKTVQKKKSVVKKKKTVAPKKETKPIQKSSENPFQAARRVWPD